VFDHVTDGADQHGDRILRTETCSNDIRHFGVGRRLDNLPLLREKLAATNERCLALQAELQASAVDTGQLAALAQPTLIGQRRIPGLKLHDDHVIRLLETMLHPGGFISNWTTREVHTRVVARHQLASGDYRLSQLRYDLSRLRAKGLVERLGTSRRYRLTPAGLKVGVLLVKLHTRLLGPLATLILPRSAIPAPRQSNSVDAAFREIDTPSTISQQQPASNTPRKQILTPSLGNGSGRSSSPGTPAARCGAQKVRHSSIASGVSRDSPVPQPRPVCTAGRDYLIMQNTCARR
jgi:hypothetical protein